MKRALSSLVVLLSLSAADGALARPNPDAPPFVNDHNGVFAVPWGAGNYAWPQQLFWQEGMSADIATNLNAMTLSASDLVTDGRMPVLSCISTTPDLLMATGGDASTHVTDESAAPGWKEWGKWRSAHPEYDAIAWDGSHYFPPQGYISPLMPMGAGDTPAGMTTATYGDFAGDRLGRLAVKVGARGIMAADAVEGYPSGALDFAPAVVARFATYANATIPAGTPAEQASYILAHLHPEWDDFRAHALANFYAQIAKPVQAAGLEPLVGAQTNLDPLLRRLNGTDYRIFLQHLPAKNWYFNYELQSDGSRAVQGWWFQALSLGLFVSREPDMPVGAQIDCDISYFWDAVTTKGATKGWGYAYLKHHFLTLSWMHVANRDGSTRRAVQAYERSYWDAGTIPADQLALVMGHIPRRPFGPAIYYSTAIERLKEATAGEGTNWFLQTTMAQDVNSGAGTGYFVSDAALPTLKPTSYPNAWIVLGAEDLTTAERAKLEAIAPVFADPYSPDAGVRQAWAKTLPIHFEGDGVSGFSFVDQNSKVVLLVTNALETATTGSWVLSGVPNGNYTLAELTGTDKRTLAVTGGKGSVSFDLSANETRVYLIGGDALVPTLAVSADAGGGGDGAGGGSAGAGGGASPGASGSGGGGGGKSTSKSGCGCRVEGASTTPPWGALALVGLALVARRRRPSR